MDTVSSDDMIVISYLTGTLSYLILQNMYQTDHAYIMLAIAMMIQVTNITYYIHYHNYHMTKADFLRI